MNAYWLFGFIAYLLAGLVLLPLAKRFPQRFGPPLELIQMIIALAGSSVLFSVSILVVVIPIVWALWPLALVVGICAPSIILHQTLPAGGGTGSCDQSVTVGAEATCLTDLKPCGKIQIEGRRLDATSLKDFIPAGSKVRVTQKRGFNLVVEEAV